MKVVKTLYKQTNNIKFYDGRYGTGYMDEWPEETLNRTRLFINSLNLPAKGTAIDYGCGTGIFTKLLKEELPDWKICGTDISQKAIQNAKKRNLKSINFFVLKDKNQEKYDFLFTHHVLEHVYDLDIIASQINGLLKAKGKMVHILPCGNIRSFEWKLANSIQNGIELDNGNRFYFEDPGHLRRLKTSDLNSYFAPYGFKLKKEWYNNHFWGALSYISDYDYNFIQKLFPLNKTNSILTKVKFIWWRFFFLLLFIPNIGAYKKYYAWLHEYNKKNKNIKSYLFLYIYCFSPIFYLITTTPFITLKKLVRFFGAREFQKKRTQRHASEMFLFFEL